MVDQQIFRHAEIYHRALVDSALDCIITIDQTGRIVEFNPAAECTFGYTHDQAMGQRISDLIIPPRYRQAHEQGMQHYLATGKGPALNRRIEIEALHRDGHELTVELTITPLSVSGQKLFTAYLRDLTGHREAQRALEESEARFRDVVEAAGEYVWEVDEQGRYTFITSRAESLLGMPADQIIGRTPFEFMPPDDRERIGQWFRSLAKTQQPFRDLVHRSINAANGKMCYQRVSGLPVFDKENRCIGYRGTGLDITEQQETQGQLDKLALVAARTNNGVIITDQNGMVEWVNEGFTRLTGYTLSQVQGLKPGQVLQGANTDAAIVNDMRKHIEQQEGFTAEVLNYHKSGQPYWVHVEVQPIKDDQGRVTNFIGLQTDITERRQREEEAKRLRGFDEFAGRAITQMAEDKSLNELIRLVLQGLGELLKVSCVYLYRFRHNESASGISHISCSGMRSSYHDASNPLGIELDPAFKTRLGKRHPLVAADLAASRFRIEDFSLDLGERPLSALLVVPMRVENEPPMFIALESHEQPRVWRDQEIKLVQTLGDNLALAIERRINQRQREQAATQLKDALERARLASQSKSVFLAHMSHEIRTPMSAVLGYAELLNRENITDEQRRQLVTNIQFNGRHLLGIINDILDFSKIEAGKLEVRFGPVDLYQVLQRAASIVSPIAEEKFLTFEIITCGVVPRYIETDETRLLQVLANLLGNAAKFTQQGSVRCSVSAKPTGDQTRLRIMVADTGPGISDKQLNAIFQPFESAIATEGQPLAGTGLGLPISRRLAELMGGHLVCTSSTGQGSCFVFTFQTKPTSTQVIEPGAILQPHAAVSNPQVQPPFSADNLITNMLAGKLILLVDDVIHNRDVIQFFLQEAGAEIVTATNGREALDWLQEHHARTDVVLMDMQMPEIDGYEATRQIRKRGWNLPVIALTAHSMTHERQRCLDAGCDDYLSKPVDQRELIARCRQAMPAEAISRPNESMASESSKLSTRLTERLKKLRDRYADELPQMWPPIEDAWREYDLERLTAECHKLAGSSGSLGYDQISTLARTIENLCAQGDPDRPILEDSLDALKKVLALPPNYEI